jgi:hypothetical protein
MGIEGSPEMLLLNNSFDLLHFHVTNQTGNAPALQEWKIAQCRRKKHFFVGFGLANGSLSMKIS